MSTKNDRSSLSIRIAEWYLRIALSAAFAVSLADRFGFFGKYGSKNVSWGNWTIFVGFSAKLTFWLPNFLRPTAAWISTIAEVLFCVALLIPMGTTYIAAASGVLLTIYALSMSAVYGFIASCDYSIWSAAAGAFLLAAITKVGKQATSH